MTSWANLGRAENKAGRFLKELEAQDLHDQLDAVRDYLRDLTGSFSKIANRQWGHARGRAADTVQEAEEMMKDNLAASLVVTLGVGVLICNLIGRFPAGR
jgi:ElaB/YqjD/DUF883 family membrane-anchored ribosome-binding protein